MPHHLVILPELQIAYARLSGAITVEAFQVARRDLVASDGFHPGFNLLIDLRSVDLSTLGGGAIHALAQGSVLEPTARLSLLVGALHNYGMGRMFQSYSEAIGRESIGVFTTPAEALAWVGASPEDMPWL